MTLNLSEIPAHYYAGNLHKWAYAPLSAGFLYSKSSLYFDSAGSVDPLAVNATDEISCGRKQNASSNHATTTVDMDSANTVCANVCKNTHIHTHAHTYIHNT